MNAPERVLKTINHEEPDRVPSFESTFTNNSIMKHYGILIEEVKYIKAVSYTHLRAHETGNDLVCRLLL